jgi:hypothetical protein
MPAGADLTAGLSEPTVAVYTDAEQIMFRIVARRLAKGLPSPSWADQKLREIQALRNELQTQLAYMATQSDTAVSSAILQAYRLGTASAESDLAGGGVAALAVTNTNTVGVLVAAAQNMLGATQLGVLRTTEDVYRKTIADVAMQTAAGTLTRREATQLALNRFADQGITGFVDSAGRNWSMNAYAEMATRTAVGRAAIDGHLETLTANGVELVIVSDSPGECPLCRPWEGEILTVGAGNSDHDSVEDATSGGLFHPGCTHDLGAYFEGATAPYKNTPDPQGYIDRQELRSLERDVRTAKLREAVAIDPQAATVARARVSNAQAAIRQHVEQTGLIRQPYREQI